MNVDRKRYIASWVLVAVFLPMLILSSVHVHKPNSIIVEECNECVHHHCHGHLGVPTTTIHACVLCQFLTLSFITTGFLTVVYYKKVNKTLFVQLQSEIHPEACGIPQLRAPPFV